MAIVITIGRQYGSGGLDVGKKIAEAFDNPFYDKDLVEMAADKSNISKDTVKHIDERATNSFLYSLVSGHYSVGSNVAHYEMPINDKLFIHQSEVIKEVAEKGPCVIVGRCADYVLRDVPGVEVCSVFVCGGLDYRTKRVMEAYPELNQARARDKVVKTDKQRRTYYDYYTDHDWGVISNYGICLNTEKIGIDAAADMVISYLKGKI